MSMYASCHASMSTVALLVSFALLIQCSPVTPRRLAEAANHETALQLSEELLNRTHHPLFIFYNRVPKTGSTTMRYHIETAGSKGFLTFYTSALYRTRATTLVGLDRKVLFFISLLQDATGGGFPLPVVFDEHFFFFNISHHASRVLDTSCSNVNPTDDADFCNETKLPLDRSKLAMFRRSSVRARTSKDLSLRLSKLFHGFTVRDWLHIFVKDRFAVKYINVVRASVDRALSLYHYEIRKGRIPEVPISEALTTGWLNASELSTYDTMKSNISHIQGASADPYAGNYWHKLELWDEMFDYQVKFFCGHDMRCEDSGSQWALEAAVENARSAYSVIGITENMDDLLDVLACRMPTVFATLKSDSQKHNVSPRLPIEDWVIDRLKTWNTNDRKLYDVLIELFKEESVGCEPRIL